MARFLDVKREFGTPQEKKLYQDMSVPALVSRLLSCRPLVFLNSSDVYMKRFVVACKSKSFC
jgi:hypothetical protein